MKSLMFRLPPKVHCFKKDSGILLIKCNHNILIDINISFVIKSNVVFFSRPLTPFELCRFKQALYGISLSYVSILVLQGVGYRADVLKNKLFLKLGYSHTIDINIPEVISIKVIKNLIYIKSSQIEFLRSFIANLRKLRRCNPYKSSGLIYLDEVIKKKEIRKT